MFRPLLVAIFRWFGKFVDWTHEDIIEIEGADACHLKAASLFV
jgi:hypothetical protein